VGRRTVFAGEGGFESVEAGDLLSRFRTGAGAELGVGLIGGKLGGGDGSGGRSGRDFRDYVLFDGLTGFAGQFVGFALSGAAELAWGHCFRLSEMKMARVEGLKAFARAYLGNSIQGDQNELLDLLRLAVSR